MGKVVVYGSLNMDLTVSCARIPEQGETLLGEGFFSNEGGKGANQAVSAARFGAPAHMIGCVGTDEYGDRLLSSLESCGVDCSAVVRAADEATGVAVVMRTGADNRIILAPGANRRLDAHSVAQTVGRDVERGDVFLAQLECDMVATLAALAAAYEAGATTVLNAAPALRLPRAFWRCVDVLCVNETECEALCGVAPTCEERIEEALAALVLLGPRTVAITLGVQGSAAVREGELVRQRALPVEAKDTTAAGDTFVGVLAACLLQGGDLGECLAWASAAAGVAVSRAGAQRSIPSRAEVERAMGKPRDA